MRSILFASSFLFVVLGWNAEPMFDAPMFSDVKTQCSGSGDAGGASGCGDKTQCTGSGEGHCDKGMRRKTQCSGSGQGGCGGGTSGG